MTTIPFNLPRFYEEDLRYVQQAMASGVTSGNGPFTKKAESLLADLHDGSRTLLTTSCTHALEMAARLLQLSPEDEVIVPAYTFVTSASAFVWNGARPVFADVRSDTLNIDPGSVQRLITSKTRAICIVHYAGVGAEPDVFREIADENGLVLVEDNAHGLGGLYNGQPLGTFGSMSTLSFHETKNITCGEGGALVVNDPNLIDAAEVLREKGTNRSKFLRGQVDKYTWVEAGSSWVMSDMLAAILVSQLENRSTTQKDRADIWTRYLLELTDWARDTGVLLPHVPSEAEHPAHMFYLVLPTLRSRTEFIKHMDSFGIMSVFHYQDLSTSPAGRKYGIARTECTESLKAADTVVRLPLFPDLSEEEQSRVIDAVLKF